MWVLETVAVAFGMYSALSVPRVEWTKRNMSYALAAFPLIGAVQGLLWWGACLLSRELALPVILRGALLCVLPVVVTGGIHLDGYADTCDARASHASPERRQEILRDPHCGAFAVIRLCVYFVSYFALCCAWEPTDGGLLRMGLGFILSRTVSALCLAWLPVAAGSSLARTFADAAARKRVRVLLGLLLAALLAAAVLTGVPAGCAMLCAALAVTLHYRHTALREFGGTSGALAGWFLVRAEFWMLAALVAVQYGEKMP